jgi:hypothetical protein
MGFRFFSFSSFFSFFPLLLLLLLLLFFFFLALQTVEVQGLQKQGRMSVWQTGGVFGVLNECLLK